MGTGVSFQFRNEHLFALSKAADNDAQRKKGAFMDGN